MNKQKFLKEIERHSTSMPIDTSQLSRWFESVVKVLTELAKQKSGILHPRHRGDARENDFTEVNKPIFPRSMTLSKGFLVHSKSSASREQDVVVLSNDLPFRLMGASDGNYHLSGSALASIEVKSNLNLNELRKSIINCISAKRTITDLDNEKTKSFKLWYSIFAYCSAWNLEETRRKINREIETVPKDLRPNSVYILGEGMLLPGSSKGLEILPEQPSEIIEKYVSLGPMGTELLKESEAYPFLWFLSSIINHCTEETSKRNNVRLFDYVTGPLLFQVAFERGMQESNPELWEKWMERRKQTSTKNTEDK